MESFQKEMKSIRDYHRRYPTEPVRNLEKAYKKSTPEEQTKYVDQVATMFSGEEGFGRFFDLIMLHEQYLNLPVLQHARRLSYLQYLDIFDIFTPPQSSIRREQKLSEPYIQYLSALQGYLEEFMRKTRPLEDIDKLFAEFDKEFDTLWDKKEVPGWSKDEASTAAPGSTDKMEGLYCSACRKEFTNEAVFEAHLSGKKHKKALAAGSTEKAPAPTNAVTGGVHLKQMGVAAKEHRIRKLAAAMQTVRSDTKVNVERKQAMTDRERQQELEQLYSETPEGGNGAKEEDQDSDTEEKIYNPLKLPLDWSGKPIPVWLWKLHGLGNEFACEICGNYVYMGRRAFDKHFNEPRHVYGLKCLGINTTTLFREITNIEEALHLWQKVSKDKKREKTLVDNTVQMEDSEGNVMPEKIYNDLAAQGIL
jgi:splicing factor 3A subunit 3